MVTKKWRHFPTGLARACANLAFVPRHRSAREEDIEKLTQFLANKQKLVVLTGAGTNYPVVMTFHKKLYILKKKYAGNLFT
jgi:hypothetical protein